MAEFKLVEVKDLGGEPIHSLMDIGGRRLATFFHPPEQTAETVHNIPNLELRDDDVMLCTGPKSGTHWGFEIISMLLNGKAENSPRPKTDTMLELASQTELDKIPSPRVLNSHQPLSALPKQLKEKQIKIVLILRNPKDMSVSFYHHHRGIIYYDYNGKFEDYWPVLFNGELDFGNWFDYVKEWERDIESGEYNIHLLFFEDLKQNGVEEIKKIAEFLGVPHDDELCRAINDKCRFEKMAVDKEYPDEVAKKLFKNKDFGIYRKGEVGDWKNYYTVAMSEEFDKLYNERMKGSKLKFRYAMSCGAVSGSPFEIH